MPTKFELSTGTLQLQNLIGLATDDVLASYAELATIVEHKRTQWRLVAREFPQVANTAMWLQQVCELLADAALQIWPNWSDAESKSENHDPRWQQYASQLARQGKRPLSAKLSRSYQLRRLSGVLAAEKLVIALLVPAQQVDDKCLLGLAKGAEWLASEANACVLLVVDTALAGRDALDSLSFEKWHQHADFDGRSQATDLQLAAVEPAQSAAPDATITRSVVKQISDENKLVHPCLGRPHPGSPGEQQLYAALEADAQLAGLFQCNLHLDTVRNTSPIVDLVWPNGKVVVEIDGYRFHSNRSSFSKDRERDYELLISGYLVLRLPHDAVIQDTLLAVEKIRDVVNYRIAQSRIGQDSAARNDATDNNLKNSREYAHAN